MKLRRLAMALTLTVSAMAGAQEYPSKPVRVIVPWTPGGGADATARVVTAKLSETLGQQFVIENRPGATGTIGSDAVAKSTPDGYTLLIGNNSTYVLAIALGMKIPYDPDRDLVPIARLGSVPHVLTVHPSLPFKTVQELIDYAKANPGKLAYSSAGTGSTPHIAGEMFMANAGVNLMHVQYKGSGQSVRDAVSGEIQVAFDTVPTVLGYIKSGRLRALAVMAPKRAAALPDVPTVAEAGVPGAEGLTWYALYGPAGMPPEVVKKLNAEVARALKAPDVRARLDAMGAEETGAESPQDMAASVRAEIQRYTKLAKEAGIKGEQ